MSALHQIFGGVRHIVAEVVETKFVVSSIGNICIVSTAAGFGVRLVVVNTIHTQTVELK